ncbi:MAG: ABC transporter permease [Proteobacteria bacterium]|nr:MAG: ABC transporter permease [Pseudomonadota bacterium]
MRNTWLVIRREFLERVRAKSFIISTILMPAFVFAITVLPTKLMSMKSSTVVHLVVAVSKMEVADAVDKQLHSKDVDRKFQVDKEIITDDQQARPELDEQVKNKKIDGYIWLTNQAIADNKVAFVALSTSDFMINGTVRGAAGDGVTRARLLQRGVPGTELDAILKPVNVDTIALGQQKKGGELAQFFACFLIAMMIYITLLMYGMSVMRSVLDEKSSRVIEVLLSSIKPKELMAGKLIGVGAVGLLQMAIWATFIMILGSPGAVSSPEVRELFSTQPLLVVFLPVFFLLGFMLYSGLFAALGAMVNSEQEAQQWQWFVMMPLIIPIVLVSSVIASPDGAMSVWLSMVPFFAPILMYVRVVASTPVWWQIAISISLMLVTTYFIVIVASRIYRVGILMYGKRPTLPEIMKWLKYA